MHKLPQEFQDQRRLVLLVTILFVCSVFVASVVAYDVSLVKAQDDLTSIQAQAQDGLVERIEEISRSQDRLVQSVFGVVGLVGTLLVVLLGLNVYQSNRNFERESEAIRSFAEAEIRSAVTSTMTTMKEASAAFERDLEGRVNGQHSRLFTSTSQSINGLRDDIVAQINGELARLQEFRMVFMIMLTNSSTEAARKIELETDLEAKRGLGFSLVSMSSNLVEMQTINEDSVDLAERLAGLRFLAAGLRAVNSGFAIPEDNEYWYSRQGQFRRSKLVGMLDKVAPQHEAINNATSDIERELPRKGTRQPSERAREELRRNR